MFHFHNAAFRMFDIFNNIRFSYYPSERYSSLFFRFSCTIVVARLILWNADYEQNERIHIEFAFKMQ